MENLTQTPNHHAAILMRGGKQKYEDYQEEFAQCDTFADFDFWKYTTDFEEIMAAPTDRLIVGTSKEEIEIELDAKYPNPHGLAMLLFGGVEVALTAEQHKSYHSKRSRRRYGYTRMQGWKVLDRPLVPSDDYESIEQLQTLSMEYDGLYIERDLKWRFNHDFKQHGFVVYEKTWSGDHIQIR